MRYKEIRGKELICINTGSRLGIVGQTDVRINKTTGKIEAFIIPTYTWYGFKKDNDPTIITWEMIKKIGNDIILINNDI